MIEPLLYALLPVALGALLALLPGLGQRALSPARTLAVAAALAVVGARLLPEAFASLGSLAGALFLGALLGPELAERAGSWLGRRLAGGARGESGFGPPLAAELGYLGLLLHQALDGAQIGAAHHVTGGLGVIIAVIAHSAPLVAVAVLGYAARSGARSALARAGILAAVSLLGAAFAEAASHELEAAEPWLAAIIAGLLLNLLGHDLRAAPPPTRAARAADAVAIALGAALPLLPPGDPHHGGWPRSADLALGIAVAAAMIARWYLLSPPAPELAEAADTKKEAKV